MTDTYPNSTLGSFYGPQGGFVEQVSTPTTFPLTVTPGDSSLGLSWDSVTGAYVYVVFCGLSPDSMQPILNTTATTFTIGNLTNGVQYFVQVLAMITVSTSVASVTTVGDVTVASQAVPYVPAGPSITVEFDSDSYASNNGSPNPIPINVIISAAPSGVTASVDYTTVNGSNPPLACGVGHTYNTCGIGGTDFTSTSGTLTWSPGDSSPKTFTVAYTTHDFIATVTLSNPVNCALGAQSTAEFHEVDF